MPRVARCPHCDGSLQVPEGLAGGNVRCSYCATVFAIAPLSGEGSPAPKRCLGPSCAAANPPGARWCQGCGAPLPVAPGRIVADQYRIVRPIALGGFGIVYLGADLVEHRPVAIKEMIVSPAEAPQRRLFFRREAAMLTYLRGAAIVPRVYEVVEGNDEAFLVMEFIPGRNLLQVLERPGGQAFSIAALADWGARICEVLERMHARRPPIVHRDLKPENIMLSPDGLAIRLIDFGAARARGPERESARNKVFTEGYAAPEQVIGKAEPRSDLFSLAATLYHLATGRAPGGASTGQEVRRKLRSGSWPESDGWFYELVALNLEADPARRSRDARAFRLVLERQSLAAET
jgi:serine/threonine protein kinase